MIEVVAVLIWYKDKFLICQRPTNKARPLLWEFVGGKVEQGETKEQALIRECKEELNIMLDVGDVFMEVVYKYPDINVHLTLFNATISEGIPQKLEHNDIKWITVAEISNYEFCPADEEILEKDKGGRLLMVTRKEDTSKRVARRKYEEKNKELRKEKNANFQTMIPRELFEEINALLTEKGMTKVEFIKKAYEIMKKEG